MTEAERKYEQQKQRREQERSVVIHGSKYGWTDPATGKFYPYSVNVNNKVLNVVYEHWKKIRCIQGAPSDKQRIEWEIPLKKLLVRLFYATYRRKLDKLMINGMQSHHNMYQEEQLNELVAVCDPDKLIKELYGKGN